MSTLSGFTARGERQEDERARSPGRSTSRGPAVVLRGWNKGMDKVAVTRFLRDSGISLARAHDAINCILRDEPVSLHFPTGTDIKAIRHRFEELGVVL